MKKNHIFIFIFIMAFSIYAESRTIAVSTFNISGNAVTQDEAEAITDLYITELEQTGKIKVVNRSTFDKVLKEIDFQTSDWTVKEKTAKLGIVVKADFIARGQIIKLGSKMFLATTIIDVNTAEIISSSKKEFSSIDDIFDLLISFAKEATDDLNAEPKIIANKNEKKEVENLDVKIGSKGEAGGIIFYKEGNIYYECSPILNKSSTWEDAKKLCQSYNNGGYSNWHLPTKGHLNSIYQNLVKSGVVDDYDYVVCWTAAEDVRETAWAQDFSDGRQYKDGKNNKKSVIAIRTYTEYGTKKNSSIITVEEKKAPETVEEKKAPEIKIGDRGPGGGIVFYISGNRCLECSNVLGEGTWEDAIRLCKEYKGGGYNDWYLPTKEELKYIDSNLRKTGKIKIERDWFWSMTVRNDDAFVLYFGDTWWPENYLSKDFKAYFCAIRGFTK